MEKLPTIKEIANKLNVSISTVSRALSNHPRIGLRTKMLVQQLAKELNYEPNPKAIFFKQKKSYVSGVIIPYIKEEFFTQAISGIESRALHNEYTILFGQSYDNLETEIRVVEAIKRQRVDGLIISLSKQTNKFDHLLSLEEKYDIPVVYFDRVPPFENINKVYCNIYNGTIEMIGWLIKRGCKKVAFINGPEKIAASKERMNGYIEGLFRKKIKVDMRLIERTDLSKESTYAAMEKLLLLKNRPQAIITFNDYVHMDAVQYALKQNIQVNKDILFLSFANLPITNYTTHPPLVSLEQYPFEQGEKAMELLIKVLNERTTDKDISSKYYTQEISSTLIMHPDN